MRAMIMAAGLGKRLRPLTNEVPKPLIAVQGKPLIIHHIEKLKLAGIDEIVVNISYLGHKIEKALGNGASWGVKILYSREVEPLEVGGGIIQALELLGSSPFIVVSGDIFTHFRFESLPKTLSNLGHLVLVPNPLHNIKGDFYLNDRLIVDDSQKESRTYGNISVLHPNLFSQKTPGIKPLAPILREAIQKKRLSGELYTGLWSDVGTLDRLNALKNQLGKSSC